MPQSLPRTRSAVALVVFAVVAALAVLVPTNPANAADSGAAAATTSSTTLRVPATGGVTLAATLTGASPMTARPTVVEFTPYGTSGKSYDVSDDFNYLLVQIRGTGDSDGTFDALGPQTQQDVANTLQWACGQSWSNGSLAVAGFSASAIMIFNSLHEKLPCVKAAVLRSGTFELYRDLLVPGGIPNSIPGLAVLGMIGAPALMEGPQRMSRNPISALTTILGLTTAGLNAGLLHPKLDSFWAQRGFQGDVNKIPTLFVDGAFDVEPRGDYMGFRQLRSEGAHPHLLVVGGHDGAPAGTDNGVAEIDKWFDHYLRGVKNGVAAEPAVQMLLANGDREDMLKGDFVRFHTNNWPAPNTKWTSLALAPGKSGAAKSINDGSLSLAAPATVTKQRYVAFTSLPTNTDPNTIATVAGGNGGPLNQLFDFVPALSNMDLSNRTGLTYTSAPLSRAVTAVGPATLDVSLASTSRNSNIWAVISDVSPDGHAHPMAVGRLNTQFPGVVADKSIYDSHGELVNPYGDYTTTSPAPLGKTRMYHVEFWPLANQFQAGHRIQLSIIGQSALSMPSLPALNTISIGGDSGSKLVFPTVGSSLTSAFGN